MAESREVNVYGYVEHSYEAVRTLLGRDPVALFRRATSRRSQRRKKQVAQLRVGNGIQIAVDAPLEVERTTQGQPVDGAPPLACTSFELRWKSGTAAKLFPTMHAKLSVWPVTPTETQLAIEGHYRPPFGPIGALLDRVVGHRIAQSSVQGFLEDILDEVLHDLAEPS
jgi:hypothetical protein